MATDSVTSQRSGPGDARDCAVTRGAVPAPLTSGPGREWALVRRREEPAQAHAGGMRSVPPRVLRGARLTLARGLVGRGQNGGGRRQGHSTAPALADGGRSPQPRAGQWLPVRGRCAGGEYSVARPTEIVRSVKAGTGPRRAEREER